VVITCYNYERYVTLAIRSALEQTVLPTEVIVVNDGSTDGSAAALAAFGDRITVITQENRGQIAATNQGYAASSGDLVMFLDADDVLRPRAIEFVLKAWTPRCCKVQFELDVINGDGELLGRRYCNYVDPYGSLEIHREFERFGTYVSPVLTGNVYSRGFLRKLMPLTAKMAPDGVFNTVAPLYGEVHVVPQALAMYRLHDANQSYHASATGGIGDRFSKQVALRRSEARLLADHAAACGVSLPAGDLLDHDLPAINYRLMLRKLHHDYDGATHDTSGRLWRAGLTCLSRRPLPMRLKLAHAVWLTSLLCSPRWFAAWLIALRFNRAALVQPIRRKVARLFGRPTVPFGPAA
jgi:glycosyltransferase involved in cell wall biosynthesis